ncbi:TIGR03915 family putative DNA repair protein [Muriicola soli]|uniref:DUF4130 domain-containing protein n=1 Tax=Muriicola soli TaxID=2507538 RepID=A0A411E986_9FLAO|nr:TIGR03915 family putative DNA repair protein [Muriicola soli]QBA64103.1 DUF4130 domain-containing protein [Muriicola soli]
MKQESGIYLYDGSFNGFLTLLFEVRYHGLRPMEIHKLNEQQEALFPQPNYIATRLKDAKTFWNSLRGQNYSALKALYFAFLSEEENIEIQLYHFFCAWQKLNTKEKSMAAEISHKEVYQLAASVEKEKRAIEIRLVHSDFPGTSMVKRIKPKYNVLPLISRYFRTRFREEDWLIYDVKRKYGLQHKNGSLAFIHIRPEQLSIKKNEIEAQKSFIPASQLNEKRRNHSMEAVA